MTTKTLKPVLEFDVVKTSWTGQSCRQFIRHIHAYTVHPSASQVLSASYWAHSLHWTHQFYNTDCIGGLL